MNMMTRLKPASQACLSFVVSLTVLITPHLAFSQDKNDPAHSLPLIEFDNVPLTDAIKNLARQTNFNFIFDPRVPGSAIGPGSRMPQPLITVRWENLSPQQALDKVLKNNNLVMVTNPATTVARFAPANLGIKPVPASKVGSDTNGVRPDVGVFDVPLDEAIKSIAKEGLHLTVTFDQELFSPAADLKGRITFRWMDISCRQTLAALLDNYDLLMIEDAANSSARISLKPKRHSDTTRDAGTERRP